jgi:hypothetical protein
MNPNIPFYISGLIFVIVALLLYAVYHALNYAYVKLEFTHGKKTRAITLTFIFLIGWLIFSAVISFSGMLLDFGATPPKIFVIVLPAVLMVIYISISTRVNKLLTVIPAGWLVYIQSYRILVELALWLLFMKNIIPVQMTFEGLNYDILIGLSAPLIGYYALSADKWPRIVALLWNFAGLLMVTNIFIIALLSTPSPLRQFFNEPPNTMVAYFPFVWIPAFIVPFAYLMHVLSIKQIIRNYN